MSAAELPGREGHLELLTKWLGTLDDLERRMAREWPPMCKVKTKTGVRLLVPAPGVEGTVIGYTPSGRLVIQAPASIPHPKHGWPKGEDGKELPPGTLIKAQVEPANFTYVTTTVFSRDDVALALKKSEPCA